MACSELEQKFTAFAEKVDKLIWGKIVTNQRLGKKYIVGDGKEDEYNNQLENVRTEAESLFISEGGSPSYFVINAFNAYFEEKGFRVGAGEKDRFGWLTGQLHTPHGAIVFG